MARGRGERKPVMVMAVSRFGGGGVAVWGGQRGKAMEGGDSVVVVVFTMMRVGE